jgi:hypothetical protein
MRKRVPLCQSTVILTPDGGQERLNVFNAPERILPAAGR